MLDSKVDEPGALKPICRECTDSHLGCCKQGKKLSGVYIGIGFAPED